MLQTLRFFFGSLYLQITGTPALLLESSCPLCRPGHISIRQVRCETYPLTAAPLALARFALVFQMPACSLLLAVLLSPYHDESI